MRGAEPLVYGNRSLSTYVNVIAILHNHDVVGLLSWDASIEKKSGITTRVVKRNK